MTRTIETTTREWRYGPDEILADGIIHGLGLVLAVGGITSMFWFFRPDDGASLLAHAVYCASLLVTLGVSAAYNLWPVSPAKWVLRRIDHAMIFGLIAGTYTPFLIRIDRPETTLLLAAIWGVSLVGMGLKLADFGRSELLYTALYIALGWSGMLAVRTLTGTLPWLSVTFIIAGGLLFSFGVIFHHWRSLRFQNAIWHGFVLGGAALHFLAVLVTSSAT